jgi:cyclic pyranopterin phosphate synthase
MLRYEEIARVAGAAASLGVSKIRLTGGEPLARLGLAELVGMLSRIPGIQDIALTTNGTLLAPMVQELKEAGLSRVNVSLDTLRPDRFRQITRLGELEDALAGLRAAQEAGLTPIKVNMVVLRSLNEDEVLDFARLTLTEPWCVRFIELMPMGHIWGDLSEWRERGLVTVDQVRERIEGEFGSLLPVEEGEVVSAGPATNFRIVGAPGTLGFISPVSAHFCAICNRLRLTADGRLRPCLLAEQELDLRTPLRAGASQEELTTLLLQAIAAKPACHHLAQDQVPQKRSMSQIGG